MQQGMGAGAEQNLQRAFSNLAKIQNSLAVQAIVFDGGSDFFHFWNPKVFYREIVTHSSGLCIR